MNQQQKAIDLQIKDLLDKAAERPGPNDPMGMVGILSTLVAAKMCSVRGFTCTHPSGSCAKPAGECDQLGYCAD